MDQDFCNQVAGTLAEMNDEDARDYLLGLCAHLRPETHGRLITLSQALSEAGDSLRRVPPFVQIPRTLGGVSEALRMTPGLHVVSGPTGHGKTQWAQMICRAACEQGRRVLMYSLEMTPQDLAFRELTKVTDFKLGQFYTAEIPPNTVEMIASDQVQVFEGQERFFIQHLKTLAWDKVRDELFRDVDQIEPFVVAIDYVQMLRAPDGPGASWDRLSRVYEDIARDLKSLAERRQICVIVLAQFNRTAFSGFQKAGKFLEDIGYVPIGHDKIKESGGIADAADTSQIILDLGLLEGCPYDMREMIQLTVDKNRKLGIKGNFLFPKSKLTRPEVGLELVRAPVEARVDQRRAQLPAREIDERLPYKD